MKRLFGGAWEHVWAVICLALVVIALVYAVLGFQVGSNAVHAYNAEVVQYQSLLHKSVEQTKAEKQLREVDFTATTTEVAWDKLVQQFLIDALTVPHEHLTPQLRHVLRELQHFHFPHDG